MNNNQDGYIVPILLIVLAISLLIAMIILPPRGRQAPYYIDYNNRWEWVHSYEERDGCVYWDGGKACGNYAIIDYRDEYRGEQ